MGLADIITKDTRIPPRGFDNAAFEAAGAPVVATTYADGQYWNDSHFWIPEGAAKAVVNVYYQTVTRHYIEALRDGNVTDGRGQELYDLWEQTNRGAPILITSAEIAVTPVTRGDFDEDGDIDGDDAAQMEAWFTGPDGGPLTLLQAIGDFDGDDDIDCDDMSLFDAAWTGPGNPSDLCQPVGACCAPDGTCGEVTNLRAPPRAAPTTATGPPAPSIAVPRDLPGALRRCRSRFRQSRQPLTAWPGGEAHYEIAMTEFAQQLHRDLCSPSTVWGYDGSFPGPTIEAGMDERSPGRVGQRPAR